MTAKRTKLMMFATMLLMTVFVLFPAKVQAAVISQVNVKAITPVYGNRVGEESQTFESSFVSQTDHVTVTAVRVENNNTFTMVGMIGAGESKIFLTLTADEGYTFPGTGRTYSGTAKVNGAVVTANRGSKTQWPDTYDEPSAPDNKLVLSYTINVTAYDNGHGDLCNGFDIILSPDPYPYDGVNKPSVTVKLGDIVVPSSEYEVEYLYNVDCRPGDTSHPPRVVLTDKPGGNYIVDDEKYFTICYGNPQPVILLDDWVFGEEPNVPTLQAGSNPGEGRVTYEYKKKGAADSTYSSSQPTEIGEYTVRVTVAARGYYNSATATKDFSILSVTAPGMTEADLEKFYQYTETSEGSGKLYLSLYSRFKSKLNAADAADREYTIDLSGGGSYTWKEGYPLPDPGKEHTVNGVKMPVTSYGDETNTGIFRSLSNVTTLNLSEWDTENVETVQLCFSRMTNLKTINLEGWKTGKVKSMASMFYNCVALTKVDVSGFDLSNLESARSMFYGCAGLKEIRFSGNRNDKLTNSEIMFSGCTALEKLDIRPFSFDNITDYTKMFYNTCQNAPSGPVQGLAMNAAVAEKLDGLNTGRDSSYLKFSGAYPKVVFDRNGHGSEADTPASLDIIKGDTIEAPAAMTDEKYDFVGWSLSADSSSALFDFDTPIEEDTTLFARWACKHIGIEKMAEAKAATCILEGNIAYWHCGECGKYFSDAQGNTEIAENAWITSALGHDFHDLIPTYSWGDDYSSCTEKNECQREGCTEFQILATENVSVSRQEPACTEDGYIRYSADFGNGHVYVYEVTLPKGHKPKEAVKENSVSENCIDDGSFDEVTYCSVCNAEIKREPKRVPALGHDWGAWTVVTPAGNTTEGLERRACKRCSVTEDRPIPVLGHKHSLTKTEASAATCMAVGNRAYYTCSDCGRIYSDEKCTTEIELKDTVIPLAAHTPDTPRGVDMIPATCLDAGSYDEVVYCQYCGQELSRESKVIPKLGHDWGEWKVKTASTAQQEGLQIRTCKHDANHIETRTVPTTDHVHVLTEVHAVPVTCVADGKKAYYTCITCGLPFEDDKGSKMVMDEKSLIIKAGHDYGKASYSWSGDGRTCTGMVVCGRPTCSDNDPGHKLTQTVTAVGRVKVPATAGQKGITTYTAKFTDSHFSTQTKDIADIPAVTAPLTQKTLNPLTVKAKKVTVKAAKVKKKDQKLAVAKLVKVSKARGSVTYKLAGTAKSKYKKYFKFDEKKKKLIVKKGLKKGTYKVKIKVTAAGDTDCKAGSKTVTVTVKVK